MRIHSSSATTYMAESKIPMNVIPSVSSRGKRLGMVVRVKKKDAKGDDLRPAVLFSVDLEGFVPSTTDPQN